MFGALLRLCSVSVFTNELMFSTAIETVVFVHCRGTCPRCANLPMLILEFGAEFTVNFEQQFVIVAAAAVVDVAAAAVNVVAAVDVAIAVVNGYLAIDTGLLC